MWPRGIWPFQCLQPSVPRRSPEGKRHPYLGLMGSGDFVCSLNRGLGCSRHGALLITKNILLYKSFILGVPVMAQWLTNPTRNYEVGRVRSLALLSGLRIQHCRQLWYKLQTLLGSCVAVVLAEAGSYSTNSTPSGNLHMPQSSPKKKINQ